MIPLLTVTWLRQLTIPFTKVAAVCSAERPGRNPHMSVPRSSETLKNMSPSMAVSENGLDLWQHFFLVKITNQ